MGNPSNGHEVFWLSPHGANAEAFLLFREKRSEKSAAGSDLSERLQDLPSGATVVTPMCDTAMNFCSAA